MEEVKKRPTLLQAFIPIACLICMLTLNVVIFGEDTLSGANQVALILAAAIAGIIAIRLRLKWSTILDQIVKSIGSAMSSMLILLEKYRPRRNKQYNDYLRRRFGPDQYLALV